MESIESRIIAIEETIGFPLPIEYKKLLLNGIPHYDGEVGASLNDETWDIAFFYELSGNDQFKQLDHAYSLISDVLPKDVVPIAEDFGGNIYGLVLSGSQIGQVVWWDHERQLNEYHTDSVAHSLNEFINAIQPISESDA